MKFASVFDLRGVTEDERAAFSWARELPSGEERWEYFLLSAAAHHMITSTVNE